jgi:hypothetical protein
MIGSELDSPFAIRCAALACLNRAAELDPSLLATVKDDWIARLCGTGKAFTCTSVLHSQMRDFVGQRRQDSRLTAAVAAIVPRAW